MITDVTIKGNKTAIMHSLQQVFSLFLQQQQGQQQEV
jgi:hypothetical protein